MKFNPQSYSIPDEKNVPFLDDTELQDILKQAVPDKMKVREAISRSLDKERLTLQEAALLLNTNDPELVEEIKEAARELKRRIYGNRIVLFAPLYIGNKCSNDCRYCGFRASNHEAIRKTLSQKELTGNVEALEATGQKRLVLVYGEHPEYSPEYIAANVREVYRIKKGNGEIRRVNINAAPFDTEGFATIKKSGIGTYQIFQETYHHETYHFYHPRGRKADYIFRLTAFDRAMEAGIDDVGLGVLFGLYDWKYEVLGLIRHTNHLEACFNTGPHTISFPRIQQASALNIPEDYLVSDEDFVKLIAILRLCVPYTGMILTARESAEIRKKVLEFGCSQIDAGTKIEIGAYAEEGEGPQNLSREQFRIHDDRSLGDVMEELISDGYLPSFCTACYRKGRTGEHFMEFSVNGFIKRYCTPNALLTMAEYLEDYAGEELAKKGWELIGKEKVKLAEEMNTRELEARLQKVREGERDLYF